jgi:rhamnosyltransferase
MVSIVVPTLDGMATLPALLDAVAAQRAPFAFEIVAVDSGSTDGTVGLLEGRVDRLERVERTAFDHGLTRNLGVETARGELVVLMVQDAMPASPGWLAALVRPLLEDASIAGSYARQAPRPDASRLTRTYLARWAAASPDPRPPQRLTPGAFARLTPPGRLQACVFDDVCSCIRRSVWAAHPFKATPIGEDLEWARDVLLAGHALVYAPDAVVVHSHERSARHELRRTRLVHARLAELFDLRLVPDVPCLLRAVASTAATHARLAEWRRPREAARAMSLAVAWPLGQYLGARDARPFTPIEGTR